MARAVIVFAVLAVGGVEMATGTAAICTGAVAFFVNVKAVLGLRLESTDLPRHFDSTVLVLLKVHLALNRASGCGL